MGPAPVAGCVSATAGGPAVAAAAPPVVVLELGPTDAKLAADVGPRVVAGGLVFVAVTTAAELAVVTAVVTMVALGVAAVVTAGCPVLTPVTVVPKPAPLVPPLDAVLELAFLPVDMG